MAGSYTITIEQGADFDRTITVKDDGVARDITGYTIRLQVRKKKSSTETFLDLDNDAKGGITISDATNGIFIISLDADETAALDVVSGYEYDLELEAPDGTVTRLLEGKLSVSGEVTR